jgi:hypothetical protein
LRVSPATCEFTNFLLFGGLNICRVHLANIPATWIGLKHAMHTHFVHPHYQRDLPLTRLEQGKNSVEEYYQDCTRE